MKPQQSDGEGTHYHRTFSADLVWLGIRNTEPSGQLRQCIDRSFMKLFKKEQRGSCQTV